MQTKNKIIAGFTFAILLVSLSLNNNYTTAEFELGEIEDLSDWFVSSTVVNFNEDFKTNLLFSFVNESLGLEITPYLTLQSEINVPLNFTGYLSKEITDDVSTYGIQIGSSVGNVSLGINGSIDLTTSLTDEIHISIEEGSTESFANFETIIGENITIPTNFSPIVVNFDVAEVGGASLSLEPIAYLNGSISLSSLINGQELNWKTGNEIYFNELSITEDLGMYNISIEDISVNFEDVHLVTNGMNVILTLHTILGDVSEDFYIDMTTVDWGEAQETLDFFIIFLLNNVFDLDDQEIMIGIDRVSYPWFSIIPILALSAIIIIRKKRR
ncbi:MAG: hypothetical protein KAJ72_00985 [Candidatus Heimdallarchaeota archaeon]|nr:hypothetical protein [Candidatus Heimdallarchaeota archaeon]